MARRLVRDNIETLAVYKPGKPIEEVQRELGLPHVIKLASNENPLGPSPLALAAVAVAAGNIHRYPDGSSYQLKHALADTLAVEPDMVLLANGSNEIIQQISLAVLNEGDEVVMPVPSFPRYEPLTRLMNAVPYEVGLRDFRIDLEAMAERVSPRTKIIYLCNPNNPTGTIVTKKDLDSFIERVPKDVLIVLDEAYFEFVEDEAYPDGITYLRRGANVIVLRTFSKIYGLAGLRVGYAIGKPDLIAYLERVREPFNVNALAQAGALAALRDREFVQRSQQTTAEGKDFLYKAFASRGIPYVPSEANFILFDAGRPEQEFFRRMLKRGVIVRGGFGYPTMLRVTVGTAEENAAFIEALDETLGEGSGW